MFIFFLKNFFVGSETFDIDEAPLQSLHVARRAANHGTIVRVPRMSPFKPLITIETYLFISNYQTICKFAHFWLIASLRSVLPSTASHDPRSVQTRSRPVVRTSNLTPTVYPTFEIPKPYHKWGAQQRKFAKNNNLHDRQQLLQLVDTRDNNMIQRVPNTVTEIIQFNSIP